MAETIIASAIEVAAVAPDEPSSPNPLKRKQTGTEEQEQEQEQSGKRQRTSPGKDNSPRRDNEAEARAATEGSKTAEHTRPTRRQNSVADEKQRSKRLFGALLGNLNQPSDKTHKRRQEIESRRKAELKRQDDERVEDGLRQQEKRAEYQQTEQVRIERRNLRIRHENMLNSANFLQTNAEPKLYYRPWDLRPDEEDRIEQQVKDTEAQIDRELDEFDSKHRESDQQERQRSVGSRPPDVLPDEGHENALLPIPNGSEEEHDPAAAAKSDGSKPDEVPNSSQAANVDETNENHDNTNGLGLTKETTGERENGEEEGDQIVDADEDAVIY